MYVFERTYLNNRFDCTDNRSCDTDRSSCWNIVTVSSHHILLIVHTKHCTAKLWDKRDIMLIIYKD